MAEIPPLFWNWDGEALTPRHPRLADKHLVVGETYTFIEHHERSDASHRRFFAGVRDVWLNLPDHLALEYPTPDALRKAALVATGYFTERRFVASSPAEARKLAAWLPKGDGVRVSVAGNAIVERTAMSQSYRAMGKAMFQKSVADVDAWIAELIGVDPQTLQREAGKAA